MVKVTLSPPSTRLESIAAAESSWRPNTEPNKSESLVTGWMSAKHKRKRDHIRHKYSGVENQEEEEKHCLLEKLLSVQINEVMHAVALL